MTLTPDAGTLLEICAAPAWADALARPWADVHALVAAGDEAWAALGEQERLEAILAHPAIGERDAAREGERREQAGAAGASTATADELAVANRAYRERFGFVFLTDATGRDAEDMLAELRERAEHSEDRERAIAEAQQLRIVRRRLRRLAGAPVLDVSTHVLDTGAGGPGAGLRVRLDAAPDGERWEDVADRRTGPSGRMAVREVPAGGRLRLRIAISGFFEEPVVTFAPGDRPRVHVPLIVSPFGFSTYLGM